MYPELGTEDTLFLMSLTCPNCGNAENFLAKTLQMHLVRVAEGQVQPPMEEAGRRWSSCCATSVMPRSISKASATMNVVS